VVGALSVIACPWSPVSPIHLSTSTTKAMPPMNRGSASTPPSFASRAMLSALRLVLVSAYTMPFGAARDVAARGLFGSPGWAENDRGMPVYIGHSRISPFPICLHC
jgi:hypothetical protein